MPMPTPTRHPLTEYPSDVEGRRLEKGVLVLTNAVRLDSADTPHGAPVIVHRTLFHGSVWEDASRPYVAHVLGPGRPRGERTHDGWGRTVYSPGWRGSCSFATAREALDYVTDECARLLGKGEEDQ